MKWCTGYLRTERNCDKIKSGGLSGKSPGYLCRDGSGESRRDGSTDAGGSGAEGNRDITVCSPITGLAADLSTVPDEAFAGKMMGDGVAVTPEDPYVRAPEDGEVAFVFDTKHAIGFVMDSGSQHSDSCRNRHSKTERRGI